MVNLELYRVFYAVAKYGSLTKAAEKLFISQPAVSQSIKQLENQLGGSLFVRTNKGMVLSGSGARQLFDKVKSALYIIDEAQSSYSAQFQKATGSIRICAADTVFTHLLADTIVSFNKKYPDIKLFLNNCMTAETIENLKSGSGDIGFVNMPIENTGVTFIDTLTEMTDIFVSKPNAFVEHSGIIPLKEMQNYPLLMLEKETSTSQAIISFANSAGVFLSAETEIGSVELIKELVKKGMGIGCMSREFIKNELENGTLKEIKTLPALPVRSIGTVVPKNRGIPFAVRLFIEEAHSKVL